MAIQSCTSRSTRILVPALTCHHWISHTLERTKTCTAPAPLIVLTYTFPEEAQMLWNLQVSTPVLEFFPDCPLPPHSVTLCSTGFFVPQPLLIPSFHSRGRCSSFVQWKSVKLPLIQSVTFRNFLPASCTQTMRNRSHSWIPGWVPGESLKCSTGEGTA